MGGCCTWPPTEACFCVFSPCVIEEVVCASMLCLAAERGVCGCKSIHIDAGIHSLDGSGRLFTDPEHHVTVHSPTVTWRLAWRRGLALFYLRVVHLRLCRGSIVMR